MIFESFVFESKARLAARLAAGAKRSVGAAKKAKRLKFAKGQLKRKTALVTTKGSAIVKAGGKSSAIVPSPGGKIRQKGGALAKRPKGGRAVWTSIKQGAKDTARDYATQTAMGGYNRGRNQKYADQIRQDRKDRSDSISAFAKGGPRSASGSKFGTSVAQGTGLSTTLGQIGHQAKAVGGFASGMVGGAGREWAGRKFKKGVAKGKARARNAYIGHKNKGKKIRDQISYKDPGLGRQGPTKKRFETGERDQNPGNAKKIADFKRRRSMKEEFELSCWREQFVWEADKKYPSGEKEKIIDVMKGKNTIEINPDEPDDKYSRK